MFTSRVAEQSKRSFLEHNADEVRGYFCCPWKAVALDVAIWSKHDPWTSHEKFCLALLAYFSCFVKALSCLLCLQKSFV